MKFLSRSRPLNKIGAFDIVEKIGEGGMCVVFLGRQASLDRPVAIKLLKEKLGHDDELRERFERESLIVARLNHPNIVHVVDRGITPDGAPYYVMEYLEGTDLAEALASGGLDRTRKLEIAIQVCRALSYAHKNGVIHRDIKPANILLDRDGNAIVLDFGIAKLVQSAGPAPDSETGKIVPRHHGAPTSLSSETRADLVLGTLAYMSPEQQSGEYPVTSMTDIYSLGVVLYEMVTGVKPFGRFRRPVEFDPSIPPLLNETILRCLASEPAARFASADEVRDRLLEILQGAHLGTEQRERAGSGLERIRQKFALLDVIREEPRGAVYLYQDRVDRRLLVIRKRNGSESGLADARLLSALRHRRMAEVLGASGDARCFIVVMEYLTGGSLRDRLLQPLPLPEMLRIGCETAEGLAFAHRNRIFHGSLRPGNILFTEADSVKLADFGFDEHVEADPYNPFHEPRSVAADILALGIILHQAGTGVLPGWKDGLLSLYPQFLRLPQEVREILVAMLAQNPAARIPGCDQVVARLHRAQTLLCESVDVDRFGADDSAEGRRLRRTAGVNPADADDDLTQRFDPDDDSQPGFFGRLTGRLRRRGGE